MTDKPILFSGPMVRALLEGRKTQTRRVLNPQPPSVEAVHALAGIGYKWSPPQDTANPWRPIGPVWAVRKLMGQKPSLVVPHATGDRLWVREAWRSHRAYDDQKPSEMGGDEPIQYLATGEIQTWGWPPMEIPGYNRPSIFMPRWASRLTLIVTDVRVQRVQEISYLDTCAEGVDCKTCEAMGQSACYRKGCEESKQAFRTLWDSLNAKRGYAWDDNPWVTATTFEVHRCNIDQMEDAA